MKKPRPLRVAWRCLLLATAWITAPAWAGCTVSVGGLNFGPYDVFAGSHTESTGTVQVSCDTATSYSLLLSAGNGTYAQRLLTSGNDALAYNLYTDAARFQVWGDGSGGTVTSGGSSSGEMVTHTIYGRIPAAQNVSAGSYADTVIITLEF